MSVLDGVRQAGAGSGIRARRRGFTLIELLIVVAIISIIVPPSFVLHMDAVRGERAAARNQAAMEQMAAVERAWRSDVREARALGGPTSPQMEETSGSLVLEMRPAPGAGPEYRVYRVTSSEGKHEPELTVTRLRVAKDGRTLSSQTLATPLGQAEFGRDEASGMLTLKLAAPLIETQKLRHEYTALAALSGGDK